MAYRPVLFLKRALLLFWAVWLAVVFATNLLDGGIALGWVQPNWAFASGNYRFLAETTARYGTPPWVNAVLFAGVIGWEGTAAFWFGVAWLRFQDPPPARRRWLYAAFTASLSLWMTFGIADEVFIAYAVEGTHWRLFTAQLVTLLAIEWLPEDGPAKGMP
jgi:hypothetical protein